MLRSVGIVRVQKNNRSMRRGAIFCIAAKDNKGYQKIIF